MFYQPTKHGAWVVCGIGQPPHKGQKVIAVAPTGAWVESTVRRVIHQSGTGSTETWIAQIKTDPLTGIVHEFSRGIAWLRSWF